MRIKNILAGAAACVAIIAASGASHAFEPWVQRIDRPDRDIVIVYTNDVHCAVDDNIGYAGFASFRDEMAKRTPYVAAVDCGDIVQGGVLGMISSGDVLIDIMNAVSYDVAVLGNHEFDYGIPRLAELMARSNADWIGANVRYTGGGSSPLPRLGRYKIMTFGPTKVAFIGVSTPDSVTTSTPKLFMRGDEYVWSFRGDSPKDLYRDIQTAVDECRISGADYVILISHLGDSDEQHGPFSSREAVRNTHGIDAVIDGHDHHVIPSIYERSKTGELVPISSTGTQLMNIGRVIITRDGSVETGLVSGWSERSKPVGDAIASVKALTDKTLSQVIARSSTPLSDRENGVRTVRSRENALADLTADALRTAVGADIGMINGGSVRNPLPSGDITMRDALNVLPFGNAVCSIRASGQQIIDALEWGARFTQREYAKDGAAAGEFGGFIQVSNLRCTIDTSIASTAEADSMGSMTSIKGARRVSGVEIFKANGWEPIDPSAEYVVGGTTYLLKSSGDGNTAFDGCETVADEGTLDYMAMVEYIRDVLRGDLKEYAAPQGRITVK